MYERSPLGNKPNCVRVMWQNLFPCSTSILGDGCSWESGWSIHLQFYSLGSWNNGSQLPSAFVRWQTHWFSMSFPRLEGKGIQKKKRKKKSPLRCNQHGSLPQPFVGINSQGIFCQSRASRMESEWNFTEGTLKRDLKGYSQILTVIRRTICLREGIILHKQKKKKKTPPYSNVIKWPRCFPYFSPTH